MGVAVPVLDPQTAFRGALKVTMPTRASIAAGVAHIPSAPYRGESMRRGRTFDMPRWYLTVSPGTVRVSVRLTAPKVHLWHDDDVDDDSTAPKRGRVSDFSRKSRARMTDTFRSLDYSPLFETGDYPALVTLTMPGSGWEECTPTPRAFKKKVNRLKEEFKRRWGRDMIGVWKMEFQERGAPHLHILMTPPRGRTRGTGEGFKDWLSKTWARIVNVQDAQAYADHIAAGTGIDWVEGQRYSDPRRIAVYFDKHAGYHEKDYQNVMPQLWRDAISAGEPGATFWGYWGLEKLTETVEITGSMAARSRSVLADEPVLHRHAQPSAAVLSDEVISIMSIRRPLCAREAHNVQICSPNSAIDLGFTIRRAAIVGRRLCRHPIDD